MDVGQWITALTVVVTGLAGLIPIVIKMWRMISATQRRHMQLWESLLLRGFSEAIQKRMVVEQVGPEEFNPEGPLMTVAVTKAAFSLYAPIAPQLREMKKNNPHLDATELAIEIETRFGPWMARNVCILLALSEFACLVMARSIAEGVEPVDFTPSHQAAVPPPPLTNS